MNNMIHRGEKKVNRNRDFDIVKGVTRRGSKNLITWVMSFMDDPNCLFYFFANTADAYVAHLSP